MCRVTAEDRDRSIRCPAGFCIHYLYNPEMDKEEREDTKITYLLIDWEHQRLYTRAGTMDSSYEWRQTFVALLRRFMDVEKVLLWAEAKRVFDAADEKSNDFNPLEGLQ